MSDTETVSFEVIGVEPVRDRGQLVALAIVEVDVAGVALTLQGVQVVRRPDASLEVRAPVFRHPRTGRWLPAVLLPPELAEAIAREIGGLIQSPYTPPTAGQAPSNRLAATVAPRALDNVPVARRDRISRSCWGAKTCGGQIRKVPIF